MGVTIVAAIIGGVIFGLLMGSDHKDRKDEDKIRYIETMPDKVRMEISRIYDAERQIRNKERV